MCISKRHGNRLFSFWLVAVTIGSSLMPNFASADDKDWCAHVAAGAAGSSREILDFSKANAHARFFGVEAKYSDLASPLIESLRQDAFHPDLNAYAAPLNGVCALRADRQSIGPVHLIMKGSVAWLTPGFGKIQIPLTAQAVVLDFRGLTDSAELKEVMDEAIASVLAQPVGRARVRVRAHHGMTSEAMLPDYANDIETLDQGLLPAQAEIGRPLAILTDDKMPPYAAELAGTLRLNSAALLIGSPIYAAVAESVWYGVGNAGLSVRERDLVFNSSRWPDRIDADLPLSAADRLGFFNSNIQAIPAGGDSRPSVLSMDPFKDRPAARVGKAEGAAALLLAHGTLRLFFKYFDVVGDHIDEELEQGILSVQKQGSVTRADIAKALGHFSQSIHDGHSFVKDMVPDPSLAGGLPLTFMMSGDQVVVVRSLRPEIHPGDHVVSFNGKSMQQALAEKSYIVSGATKGYHDVLALENFAFMHAPIPIVVQSPNGKTTSVTLNPILMDQESALLTNYTPFSRKNGYLGDWKAPKLFYLNPDAAFMSGIDELGRLIVEAQGADGLILDLRGYPAGGSGTTIASTLLCNGIRSPIYLTPEITSLDQSKFLDQSFAAAPSASDPHFCGPVIVLYGPTSVSQSENVGIMLRDAGRVRVIGRESAGSDGGLTAVVLPGDFAFSFTGQIVRHLDGSSFHGVGILPDFPVEITPEDLASGHDPDLAKAIELLKGRPQ